MVYEYKTHRIIIENPYKKPTFSLTIGTLEIVVDYDTKQIIYVQGFLPLIKAGRAHIVLPKAKQYCPKNGQNRQRDVYGIII